MTDRLLGALTTLARQRRELQRKEQQIQVAERRVMAKLGGLLAEFGYHLVSADGPAPKRRDGAMRRRALPKTLACPKCDRRFSHQMHVARHLNAMHGRENM
jgi:hypothetical protein